MTLGRFFAFQLLVVIVGCALSFSAHAARVKDIANVRGVRDNQLIGYGIVVGLKGTGDSKSEFTNKSIARMFDKLGVKLETLSKEQSDYLGVPVQGPYKPEHYRY